MRAVLDPNILIAALLSPTGAPAQLLGGWLRGEFELVVSEALLAELARALVYPKLRVHVPEAEATAFATLLRHGAILAPDPREAKHRSADPADDYLLSLAEHEHAVVVSADHHLLALVGELPVHTARTFLDSLARA